MECSGHIRDGLGSVIDEGLGCLSERERGGANEIAGGGTMGRGRGGRRLIEEGAAWSLSQKGWGVF